MGIQEIAIETLQYGNMAKTIPLTSPDSHKRFWISWNALREAVQVRKRRDLHRNCSEPASVRVEARTRCGQETLLDVSYLVLSVTEVM